MIVNKCEPKKILKLKICGITNLEDAQLAIDLGADFIGFINYEKSPRFVSIEKIKEIVGKLRIRNYESPYCHSQPSRLGIQNPNVGLDPLRCNIGEDDKSRCAFVGVFVNKNLNELIEIANENIFDVIQLHGDESAEYVQNLKAAAENVKIWKAFRIKKADDVRDLAQMVI